MARVPRAPRPPRGGTPAGMEGVRPGSPAAVAAGYRPPRAPRSPRTPPRYNLSLDEEQKRQIKQQSLTPPPTVTTPFKPDAAWWTKQFAADNRYMTIAPAIVGRQQTAAESYGYTIDRSPQGQPYYVSRSTGVRKILQQLTPEGTPALDENGRPIYTDEQGNRYNIGDLDLSITEKKRGEEGYLAGALGGTTAESERRQFGIGDVAAQAGVGRSGMRGQATATEAQNLINALRNLQLRAAGEFAGGQTELANLYNDIYKTLVETAGSQPGTTTETPAATPPSASIPIAPPGISVPSATPPGMEGIRPGASPWWDRLNPGQSSNSLLVPPESRGNFTVSGRPGGSPPQNPAPGTAYMGNGGVVWVYRSQGPNGAGWYRRP